MKCGELKPGDSWRECDQKLKHSGPHRYLNESWPRVVPNEPNPDVEALLDRTKAARSWGLDERRYPIIVIETVTRLMWVDADDEDDALSLYADDYSDIDLDGTEVLDGELEFRRLDDIERINLQRTSPIGPVIACPECGDVAMTRRWYHNPLRKCHGPIEWTETRAPNPQYRWRRKFQATPIGGIREAVAA
ncbi:hypothetical protein [Streptomyces sp. NPDC050564]|uniref:hypothetical protein n=1 Tax=Streptomyces sp. NPDC050564 TaxID=3365631 RepID=UPI0037BE112C